MTRFIFHIVGVLATFSVVSYGVFFALLNRQSSHLSLPFIGDFFLPFWFIILGFFLLGLFLGLVLMMLPLILSKWSRRRLAAKIKNLERAGESDFLESKPLEKISDKTGFSQ